MKCEGLEEARAYYTLTLPPSVPPFLPPSLPPSQHFHPDGHIAPVRDLFGHMTVGTQTPPRISTTHSSPSSSLSPSPYPLPSSPSTTTPTTPQADLDPHVSTLTPGTPDYSQNSLHPPSPKPSFIAREPPDGAEWLTIRPDTK